MLHVCVKKSRHEHLKSLTHISVEKDFIYLDEAGLADLTMPVSIWMNWSADDLPKLNPAPVIIVDSKFDVTGKYLKSKFVFIRIVERRQNFYNWLDLLVLNLFQICS